MSRRDAPRLTMIVTGQGLAPRDRHDGELLSRYPVGSEVSVEVRREPNPAFLKLLWAVVNDVYPSTDWPTADALMTWLKVRARHVESFTTMGGGLHINPRSLSTFDHDDLVDFGGAAFGIIAAEWGIDVDRLARERRRTIRSGA
jgi:hypothetical protein